ncbi:MAG: hypothetical protein QN168_03465 [Armatimonadota bacterium]|nr:hypothetical protein [Armatimonadota bacterium]
MAAPCPRRAGWPTEQPPDSPDASLDFSLRTGGATGGLGWWWHTPEDLPDKIDPDVLVRDCRIYLGIVHAFATEAILPLDYGATARRWQAALRALPREVGRHADLRPVVAEAQRLVDATGTLERTIRRVRADPSRRAVRAANAALLAMGRALIPIGHTQAGPFHPDPALELPEMPVLAAARALGGAAGDEARHLAVRAVRDLNAVRGALAQAADAAEDGARTVRGALSRSRR